MKNYWSRRELEALGEPINPELPTRLNGRAGGGGKGGGGAMPDYQGLADAQADASFKNTRYQTFANRPTIKTHEGTQSWNVVGGGFDEEGYNQAMQAYKDSYQPATGSGGYWKTTGNGGDQGYDREWVEGSKSEGTYALPMPEKDDFISPERWEMETKLNPTLQAAVDSQQRLKRDTSQIAEDMIPGLREDMMRGVDYEGAQAWGEVPEASAFSMGPKAQSMSRVGKAPQLQTHIDRSNLNQVNGLQETQINNLPTYDRNYVNQVKNETLDYMRPEMEAEQEALDAKLAAQGITAGSEAYERAQRRLSDQQSRNEYNALQVGMNQANQMYNNQLAGDAQRFGQEFGQNRAMFDTSLARNQNQFQQNFNAAQFGNNANQAMNQMNLANTGFNNGAMQSDYDNAFRTNAYNNDQRARQFDQQMQQSAYANQLRQAQIGEQQARQVQALNNMQGLLNGQQVGMMQAPAFNMATKSETPQYLNAAGMQLQHQQMNNASANSFLNGAFQLGGTLGGAYLGNPAAFG